MHSTGFTNCDFHLHKIYLKANIILGSKSNFVRFLLGIHHEFITFAFSEEHRKNQPS